MLSRNFVVLFFGLLVSIKARGESRRFTFELQSWKASCRLPLPGDTQFSCQLPLPDLDKVTLEIDVADPRSPREARTGFREFGDPKDVRYPRGRLTIYRVRPESGSILPPHLQVRLEILSPVRLLCLESVRDDGPAVPLPTLHCASFDARRPLLQRGFNLVSQSVTSVGPGAGFNGRR